MTCVCVLFVCVCVCVKLGVWESVERCVKQGVWVITCVQGGCREVWTRFSFSLYCIGSMLRMLVACGCRKYLFTQSEVDPVYNEFCVVLGHACAEGNHRKVAGGSGVIPSWSWSSISMNPATRHLLATIDSQGNRPRQIDRPRNTRTLVWSGLARAGVSGGLWFGQENYGRDKGGTWNPSWRDLAPVASTWLNMSAFQTLATLLMPKIMDFGRSGSPDMRCLGKPACTFWRNGHELSSKE